MEHWFNAPMPLASDAACGDPVNELILIPNRADFSDWLATQREEALETARAWAATHAFEGKPGQVLTLPPFENITDTQPLRVLAGGQITTPWDAARIAAQLPSGLYRPMTPMPGKGLRDLALGFGLNAYVFDRYKSSEVSDRDVAKPVLLLPPSLDRTLIEIMLRGRFITRDLVNTPANDMGPAELAASARTLAQSHGAEISAIVGEELLQQNFPAIHAVGRASVRAPRLVDMIWGDPAHPKVTLVGKGVCFDTGGLDLKPSSAMLNMKKDMGGAAQVLGLAYMIMAAGLPVRLRVLIPAVENAVGGSAFRPRDVLQTRKGLTVEVGNTDAEGRLVLCDALTFAAEEEPALIVDFATLTGAARVALGPELPAMFTPDDELATRLHDHGAQIADPVWRLPLWASYGDGLTSKVADTGNVTSDGFAGSITAALFLQKFIPDAIQWVHFDVFAWNPKSSPGRPEGGEAQGVFTMFEWIRERFTER